VSTNVLPAVTFERNGLTIAWMTVGPRANVLSYTVSRLRAVSGVASTPVGSTPVARAAGLWCEPRDEAQERPLPRLPPHPIPPPRPPALCPQATFKLGGPTVPDFAPFRGTPNKYCSLLDINPASDLDSNPADGVADASTVSLVGRVPRAIPGRPGYYVCAVAPAGGYVRARRGPGLAAPGPVNYAYAADGPNVYMACGAGGYLYKLGAINAPGDRASDFCVQCPRGSYATAGAALCAACPPNSYQDKPGQRACKRCQFGYAPVAGAARCMDCYYGRPYCSEGYTPSDALFTCNSNRLPEGYGPEGGFSIVRPSEGPPPDVATAAAKFAPLFRNCHIGGDYLSAGGLTAPGRSGGGSGGGGSLLALNVSAECRVDLYALGDLGRGPAGCSQNPRANSLSAFYSAPNILAGLGSKGLGSWRVGLAAKLDGAGLAARVFATAVGARIPDEIARPAHLKLVVGLRQRRVGRWVWRAACCGLGTLPVTLCLPTLRVLPAPPPLLSLLQLPDSGWSYLGGGDNGQGLNANVKGVNFDPCPPGGCRPRAIAPGGQTRRPLCQRARAVLPTCLMPELASASQLTQPASPLTPRHHQGDAQRRRHRRPRGGPQQPAGPLLRALRHRDLLPGNLGCGAPAGLWGGDLTATPLRDPCQPPA
jgi:hypothetical protein